MAANKNRPRTEWEIEAKKRMVELQMSNVDLAKACGIVPNYVSRILNGMYSEKQGRKITEVLGLSVPYPGTENNQ